MKLTEAKYGDYIEVEAIHGCDDLVNSLALGGIRKGVTGRVMNSSYMYGVEVRGNIVVMQKGIAEKIQVKWNRICPELDIWE